MAERMVRLWGEEARFAVPRGDEDDVVCLFPALAAHVAEEALLRDLDREEIGARTGRAVSMRRHGYESSGS